MVYQPHDWIRAVKDAAKLLLLSEYDLDEFGYFNEVPLDQNDDSYNGEFGIEYVGVNPADPAEEPRYTFNDSATAAKFDGCLLIGRLAPGVPLLKRHRDIDYKDKVAGVIRIFTDFDNDDLLYPEVEKVTRNDLTIRDLSVPMDAFEFDNRNSYIRQFDLRVWQHHNYGLFIDGSINPISEALLQLNGQDRQQRRDGFYYNIVEAYEHHTDTPCDGLNMFCFALNPEEHQPSGTCNFSRIDTAQLNLWFNEFSGRGLSDIYLNTDNHVMIFAINYNVLRIMSGMGGLAYSN